MISVLSLVVAILAVFFGPLVGRANIQRQLQVTSREAWMRDFRELVAQFLTSVMRRARAEAGTSAETKELRSATLSFFVTKLLLAEKGAPQYDDFEQLMNRLLRATAGRAAGEPTAPEFNEVGEAAGLLLRRERAMIGAAEPVNVGAQLGAWSQFVAWCRRPPPKFPD